MKLLYIDLDGVVADFVSAMNTHSKKDTPPYHEHPDTIPHIFRDLTPIKGAINAVNKLLDAALKASLEIRPNNSNGIQTELHSTYERWIWTGLPRLR